VGIRRSRTPHNDRSSPLDAVTTLITERDKYEQWLDELEAKKESTPAKVFDRVRKDYLSRLQAVMDQLKEHTAVLQAHAANLVAKLRDLEAKEQAITDELAETELRAQVGEITEAEWEATSRKAQREVAKLKENQEVIADDLIKIRDILSGDDDVDEDEDAPRTSADFDELEFLKSVVGASTAETRAPAPRPSGPSGAKPVTPTSSAAQGDKPASVTQPIKRATPSAGSAAPPRATPAATTAPAKPETAAVPSKTEAPDTAKKTPQPVASSGPDNALGIKAQDMPDEQRTLKCPECGTMNYASEWYCERCGAELAAI
jgi:Zn-finger in Ran binding protein and others